MPVLLTTAYLPPVRYMAEAIRADEIIIEANENYLKQTCRNHCSIYGPNGMQTLSIPVIRVDGNHTLTKDIRISDQAAWQKIHWRSIETAYNNSPFFLFYKDHFIRFYEKGYRFLLDLNNEILQVLLGTLETDRAVRITECFEKAPAGVKDLRGIFGLKAHPMLTSHPAYPQVFESTHGFIPGLSVLDLIFNLGPETPFYLEAANFH